MLCRSILVLLLFLASLGTAAAQDRLQGARDAVRAPFTPTAASSSSGGGCDEDNGWDEFLGEVLGPTLLVVLGSPFYVPAKLLDDDWDRRLYLPRYPYVRGYPGYLLLSEAEAAVFREDYSDGLRRRRWAGRLSLENGNDFSGLNRFNGQLRIDTCYRLGLLTNWNYFHEHRRLDRPDELVLGDTNLIVRFAQNEVAGWYAGLGVRTMTDRCRTDVGFNFTYGGEWFPARPWVLAASFDVGTLGSATVLHGRTTVGLLHRRWELFGGYDFLRIGPVNLQGPLLGLRFWF